MKFVYALAAGVLVAVGCGAPAETSSSTNSTGSTVTSAPAAPTTTASIAVATPTTTVPSTTVPIRGEPTTTTLPVTPLPPPASSATDPPRVVAAPGPPIEDASCRGEIVGTFTYVDGSTAAVRATATDFCVADGAAGMTMPYMPASDAATPYIGGSGDSWLGSFAVVALPSDFPATFTVWRADGVQVPAVLGVDGRSLLVRTNDSALPSGYGELTFRAADGTVVAVTGPF